MIPNVNKMFASLHQNNPIYLIKKNITQNYNQKDAKFKSLINNRVGWEPTIYPSPKNLRNHAYGARDIFQVGDIVINIKLLSIFTETDKETTQG